MPTVKDKHIRKDGTKLRIQQSFDPEEGRTKQSHKDECDINQIMSRFQRTGAITHFNQHSAHYEDLTGFDYTEAMQQVAAAQSMFNELPSSLRDRFQHDPANFLDFVQDPANTHEMAELGLLNEAASERIAAETVSVSAEGGLEAGGTPPTKEMPPATE